MSCKEFPKNGAQFSILLLLTDLYLLKVTILSLLSLFPFVQLSFVVFFFLLYLAPCAHDGVN